MANGHKKIILQLKDAIDAGGSVRELVKNECFFAPVMQYRSGLQWYEQLAVGSKRKAEGFSPPTVYVLVGPPGSGKSRYAWEAEGFGVLYPMPCHDMKWCGSYDGDAAVLFDDVTPKSLMPIDVFLRLCDGYPMEVESKGGFKWWMAKRIYITSNYPVSEWWPEASYDQQQAISRRITLVTI